MLGLKRKTHESSNGFEHEFGNFFSALCYLVVTTLLAFIIFMVLAMFRISSFAFNTYDSLNNIPYNEVGLLLGTSSLMSDGNTNPFFVNRIRAAALLYKKGKIKYVLVSGDNMHASYNEPRQMTLALIRAGVPKENIIADYAGFSTIDSVARAHRVFMLKNVTVISQEFQNERALFIANNEGMSAIGFNASDPASKLSHYIVYVREFFARVKCVLDIYFFDTQPTYLGAPVQIGSSPLPKQPSNKPKRATSRPKQPGMSASALHNIISAQAVNSKEQTDASSFLKQKRLARERLEQTLKRDLESQDSPDQTEPAAPSVEAQN